MSSGGDIQYKVSVVKSFIKTDLVYGSDFENSRVGT